MTDNQHSRPPVSSDTSTQECKDLPPVLAGPILRRSEPKRLVLWLLASRPLSLQLHLSYKQHFQDRVEYQLTLDTDRCQQIPLGQHAWLHLIEVHLERPLPQDEVIEYDLEILDSEPHSLIAQWAPHLLYPGQQRPNFCLRSRVDHLLHGSCRKPHHPSGDGLLQVDRILFEHQHHPQTRPALLMMSGDQIYADDVAGPMLAAIHELIAVLGLYDEYLEGACIHTSQALYQHPASYYRREDLLPAYQSSEEVRERFFGGVRKPIFTTANAHNHLISLAEVIAMYLLVWSPIPWQLISQRPPQLPKKLQHQYQQEQQEIQRFVSGLPQVARALAHIPCLMIFDDHDVTDDWNLSASWEQTAYQHAFSRRIVGNALLGYLLCQGWGNAPEHFTSDLKAVKTLFSTQDGYLNQSAQDQLVDRLLKVKHWHYSLPTQPPIIVLDTRTRRWHDDDYLSRPSGLMDWEALCELQNELLDQPNAIIISAAPMFGVKLIEAVQKIFTWAGYPLLVDAENWMAHSGAAKVMLNIFCHSRTPANYLILSGDVHYSFTYQVLIRRRDLEGPHIWQVTSSGIKNEFPTRLLACFDHLNRWLYSPRSPLNWFTKRRRLEVNPCPPDSAPSGRRLWNQAGIGQVHLDTEGCPIQIHQCNTDGTKTSFIQNISKKCH